MSQTPEPSTGATDAFGGFTQWAQNIGIVFAKGLGIGLYYLGFGVIVDGVVILVIWHV